MGRISTRKSILIIDDEPDILDITEKFLTQEGYNTYKAPNGKFGLDLLKDKSNEIALVLLDIMMPGQSGFVVLKEIRANKTYKGIKVLLFSVKSHQSDVEKGMKLGADGYIVKPISGKDLISTIKNVL